MRAPLYLIPLLAGTVSFLIRAGILRKQRQIYVLKPISTLIVIAVASLSLLQPERNVTYSAGVLLGLTLSFGGDLALMFEENRRAFTVGLGFFLLAHVTYAVVFALLGRVSWWDALSTVILLAAGVGVYRVLKANLGAMRGPVIAYTVVISVMVSRAVSTLSSPELGARQAVMVAVGAVLFYVSDVILAASRFWKPWEYRRISLAFYYGGQLLIALAASGFR
jgi:uncharacterized membrane protein YhhN